MLVARRIWVVSGLMTCFVFAAVSLGMLLVVPPGEAPDEPAHIEYVGFLLREGRLPDSTLNSGRYGYETHQPPLYYLTVAAFLRLLGQREMGFQFVPNPDFEFAGDGRPAFVHANSDGSSRALRNVRLSRLPSVFYGLIFVCSIFLLNRDGFADAHAALLACTLFSFVPQVAFLAGSVNNDVGLLSMGALATLGLTKAAISGSHRASWLAFASMTAGLAIWMKVPGVVYVPGLLILAGAGWRKRDFTQTAAALVPLTLLLAGLLLSNFYRFDSIIPALPTGWDSAGDTGLSRLMSEPWWVVSTWGSFWAKFGWFNLPLPSWVYAWFVVPSALVLVGFIAMMRSRRLADRRLLPLLGSIVATNAVLFVIYLSQVDWQPQGRYLFPSIGAFSVLCAYGLQSISEISPRWLRTAGLLILITGSIGSCFFSVYYIWQNYLKWGAMS